MSQFIIFPFKRLHNIRKECELHSKMAFYAYLLVVAFAAGAFAQADPAPAGTAVTGVWNVNLGGTPFQMRCVGVNDYAQVDDLDGVPDIDGGVIPVNPSGGTQGKLHCKYPNGFMQFAIQGNSLQLNGRWYSGGWENCYDTSRRTCYVGGITLSRDSADTGSQWTGTWNCDDDENAR